MGVGGGCKSTWGDPGGVRRRAAQPRLLLSVTVTVAPSAKFPTLAKLAEEGAAAPVGTSASYTLTEAG